jgi:predicted ABC-type sugar transport system permease subunit
MDYGVAYDYDAIAAVLVGGTASLERTGPSR